jgi:hypothetical protein
MTDSFPADFPITAKWPPRHPERRRGLGFPRGAAWPKWGAWKRETRSTS